MVEPADIERLLAEVTAMMENSTEGSEVEEWTEKEGISGDSLVLVGEASITVGINAALAGEGDAESCLHASAIMAFCLGWEAAKQYGKNR